MTESNLNIQEYDFDRDLIESVTNESKPRLKIYRLDRQMVVIGRGGKVETELQTENIDGDGIPVYRRQGGGCAVVIDPGNIIISVVLPVKGFTENRYYFNLLSAWIEDCFKNIGFPRVEMAGISDLMIDNRKISGSCIYNGLDYLYYSTTILVHPDTEAMERYLRYPPREPDYRKGRRHSDFVTGLDSYYTDIEVWDLIKKLEQSLNLANLNLKNHF